MDLQILSDLHLETPKAYDIYEIKPIAPCLALLGDIGCVSDRDFLTFLTAQLTQFRVVLHLMGNHEAYGSSWGVTTDRLRAFQEGNLQQRSQSPDSGIGEYVLLDRNEFHLPHLGLTILGCTLFSNVPAPSLMDVSFGLNDFFSIDDWTVEQHVKAHERDLAWLNERVLAITQEDPGRRLVIFTHHSPTLDSRTVNPRFSQSKISSGFATDLSGEICWKNKNVTLWAFGHTHYNFDRFRDEDTGKTVYTNQRGYYFAQAAGLVEGGVVHIG